MLLIIRLTEVNRGRNLLQKRSLISSVQSVSNTSPLPVWQRRGEHRVNFGRCQPNEMNAEQLRRDWSRSSSVGSWKVQTGAALGRTAGSAASRIPHAVWFGDVAMVVRDPVKLRGSRNWLSETSATVRGKPPTLISIDKYSSSSQVKFFTPDPRIHPNTESWRLRGRKTFQCN